MPPTPVRNRPRSAAAFGLRSLLAWVAVCGVVSCDGCSPKTATAPLGPKSYVSLEDDVVLTGQTSAIVSVFERWRRLWDKVLTPTQMEQLRKEAVLAVGFDPLSRDGLMSIGLDPDGRWAAGWSSKRSGWLVAFPALDPEKLAQTLVDAMVRRYGAQVEDLEGGGRRLTSAFGPETVDRGAVATRPGTVLWMTSSSSGPSELVPLAEDRSAAQLDAGQPPRALRSRIRLDPASVEALAGALNVEDLQATLQKVSGWIDVVDAEVDVTEAGFVATGRAQPTAEGRAVAKALKPKAGPALQAVSVVQLSDSFLRLRGALDPQTAYAGLMPPGSPMRRALQQARADGTLAFDFEKDLLPALSGSMGLAMGAGDLSEITFKELVGNPQAALWTAFALGRKSDVEASSFQGVLNAAREAPDLQVTSRRVGSDEVFALKAADVLLTELVQRPDVYLASNEPVIINRMLSASPSKEAPPLAELVLDFGELHRNLSTFRAASLPLFVRATWAQILDALSVIDVFEVRAEIASDTMVGSAALRLEPADESTP